MAQLHNGVFSSAWVMVCIMASFFMLGKQYRLHPIRTAFRRGLHPAFFSEHCSRCTVLHLFQLEFDTFAPSFSKIACSSLDTLPRTTKVTALPTPSQHHRASYYPTTQTTQLSRRHCHIHPLSLLCQHMLSKFDRDSNMFRRLYPFPPRDTPIRNCRCEGILGGGCTRAS